MPERRRKLKVLCIHVFLVLPLLFGIYYVTLAPRQWQGVDEAVVEKIAKEHGREAKPALPAPEGDVQLFVFLLAGVVGGFSAGYWWRMLIVEKRRQP